MKYLYILLFASLCFISCSKDENDEPPVNPQKEEPKKGTDTRPVAWTKWQEQVGGEIYPVTSMTFVADAQGIEVQATEYDIMAAFINGQCRGCAEAQLIDNKYFFFLTVCLLEGEDANAMVTYRYYSHTLTKIYSTDPSRFVSDGKMGSFNNPYHFNWKKPL